MKKTMNFCWRHKGNIVRNCWRALPVASVLALTACSSMPYKIVPNNGHQGPASVCAYRALTIGSIEAGNYHAAPGASSMNPGFTVAVPKSVMTADPNCRPIADGESSQGRYVTFGPTAEDKTVYRLSVGTLSAKDHPFFNFSEGRVSQEIQKMVNHYHAPVTKLYERYYVYRGHSTRFAVYQQHLDGNGGSGAIVKGGETLTQIVYVIKQHQHYAVFWITASSASKKNWVNGSNRMSVLQHRWAPVKDMLDSFSMPAPYNRHKSHAVTVHNNPATVQPLPPPPPHQHVHMNTGSSTAPLQPVQPIQPPAVTTAPATPVTTVTTTGSGSAKTVHLN